MHSLKRDISYKNSMTVIYSYGLGLAPVYDIRTRGTVQPRILIATTTWWAMPARMALAFAQAGGRVSGVFPDGSPLAKVQALQAKSSYSAMFPVNSLKRAIEAVKPDLIVPCDDRVVEHLHALYTRCSTPQRNETICSVIERSLGDPSSYSVVTNRSKLLEFAQKAGIRVPRTGVLHQLSDLRRWLEEHGLPAVLKLSGTWGGSGVRVVRSWEEAEKAFRQLTESISLGAFLNHISFHDFYPLFAAIPNRDRDLTVQTYIEGRPANAMFASWDGDVLGDLSVEVLFSQEKLGASTIVRTIANTEMEEAGRLIARNLRTAGFFGLDFILETSTGRPWLIELNPRATQIGHLEPAGGRSLTDTLYHQLVGAHEPELVRENGETIAFFPQCLQCSADHPILAQPNIRHDVPWEDSALLKELTRRPWNSRHLSASLYSAAHRTFRSRAADSFRRTTRRFVPKDPRI